jgi:hypothetical protein
VLIGIACLAAGCARPAAIPSAVLSTVYVNREALVRRHPLWIEADRIADGAKNNTSDASSVAPPKAPSTLKIPALTPDAAVQTRRSDARGRLETVQRRGLSALDSVRDTRVEDAVSARRLELEAAEDRVLAEREQGWREDGRRRVDAALQAVTAELAVLQTALESVDAQLKEGFLVAVPPDVLSRERARLAGSEATVLDDRGIRRVEIRWSADIRGVSPRARLSAARDAIAARIARISLGLEAERQDARSAMDRERETAKAEARARITREVDRVREERRIDLAPLLEQQNFGMLLERTLAMESTPSATLGAGDAQGLARETDWSTVRLAATERLPDIAMVARMRSRALALVDARITDLSRTLGVSAVYRPIAGVPDRTGEFARRIGLQGE